VILVLAYGTEPGLVVLKSDASGIGVGGVFVLRHPDNHDQPIGYYSIQQVSIEDSAQMVYH